MNETASKIRLKIENVVEYNISQKAFLCSVLDNYAFLAYHERMNNLNNSIFTLSLTAFKQISNEGF